MKKGYLIIVGIVVIIIVSITILFLNLRIKVTKPEALDIAYKHFNIEEKNIETERIENIFSEHYYKISISDSTKKYEIKIDSKTGEILESAIDNQREE